MPFLRTSMERNSCFSFVGFFLLLLKEAHEGRQICRHRPKRARKHKPHHATPHHTPEHTHAHTHVCQSSAIWCECPLKHWMHMMGSERSLR